MEKAEIIFSEIGAENVLKVTGGAWWPADRVEVEANQEFIHSALGAAELSAAQKRQGDDSRTGTGIRIGNIRNESI